MISQNLSAFLRVIRAGESSQDDDAYRVMFGGQLFDSFADHPRRAFQSSWGWTSAAGAYQAMCAVPGKVKTDTWGDFIRAKGPRDFSPESQDEFAAWCIRRRGALDDVEAGRIETAIAKCGKEWASLPGSPYGQPTRTLAQALATYAEWGGSLASAGDAPAQPSADQSKEKAMPPFLLSLLPSLVSSINIPAIIDLFKPGVPVSERNTQLGIKLFETAKTALGAVNEQEVVERLAADKEAAAVVRKAVEDSEWFSMVVVEAGGGGVDGARKANAAAMAPDAQPFWHSPVFWITLLLLPLVYGAGYAVLFTAGFTSDIRAMVLGAIFGGLLTGGIQSFWFGTSASSARKTELSARPTA